MGKSIVFIDSAVPDYNAIISGLASDIPWYIIDSTQDGLQQMADILAGYTGLDAIHLISHGSPGSLQLGDGIINEAALATHGDTLAAIGNSLSQGGDLLLYGCDVALGEFGQSFIQQLAFATGADVAASTDLTGSALLGGDWVLEAATGPVDSPSFVTQWETAYTHTLTTATSLNFSATDQNMWGTGSAINLDVTWDDLLYTDDITQSFSSMGFSGTAELHANVGLLAHLAASTGDVDLNYQMTVNAQTPDVVKSGEYFIFDTSSYSLTNGLLSSLGPDIASTEFTLDFLFNVGGGLHDLQYDPPLFDPILFDDLAIDTINLDQNLVSIGTGNASYELSGDYGSLSFAIPGAVAATSDTQTSSQTLTSLVATGLSSTALGTLNLDLDAIAHGLFPATIPALDYNLSRGDFNLDLTLLDADANLNAYVAQQFTFTPTAIRVDLSSSYNNEHRSGELGEQFIFSTPTSGAGNITITATYTIDGVLRNQTGLALEASLDVTALNLNIDGNLVGDWGFNWAPFGGPLYEGSFPDGGLSLGSPLYLYDQSFTWDGFDSETASYTVAYSDTAATGGQFTSTDSGWMIEQVTIVGTPAADTLYGNDLNNIIEGLAANDRIYASAGNDTIDPGAGDDIVYAGTGDDTINVSGNSGTDTVSGGTGTDTLNIDWSAENVYYGRGISFSVHKADGSWEYFGELYGVSPTIDTMLAAFAASPTEFGYTYYYDDSNFYWFNNKYLGVTFSGIERINVDGTIGNDFIIAQVDSSAYAGNGGVDTFFGDFSSWNEAVTWTNGADVTKSYLSDGAVSTLGATHQLAVSGMENLLLLTGSGNDVITQNVTGTNNEIRTGVGNDIITTANNKNVIDAGAGNDTITTGIGFNVINIINAGAGNDTITIANGFNVINGGAGDDTINISVNASWGGDTGTIIGGTGTDTLNIDLSAMGLNYGMRFKVHKADGSWEYFGEYGLSPVSPTVDTLLAAFSASPTEYGYTFSSNDTGDSFSGIERINVDGTSGNDVIVAQTDSSAYAGNGGTDTFFGDFSSWTEAVIWTNGADATDSGLSDGAVSILGTTHQIAVSGMENLLLLTGSGNDIITQNVTGTNSEIRTGGGNDTINISNTINTSNYTGSVTVIGGTGSDTLDIDWSAVNPCRGYYGINFSVHKADGNWVGFGEIDGVSPTVDTLLAAFAASPTEFGYTFYYENNYNSYCYHKVTFLEVERINVDGTTANDVIIAQTDCSAYAGNGGTDTFFGDFSSWTEAVIWTNGAEATNSDLSDEAVSTLGGPHQIAVSGMENLLLLTGSGNDVITQNVTASNNEIRTGGGNDTIILSCNVARAPLLIVGSNGTNIVDAGIGNDTIDGGAGNDTIYAGAGDDIINISNNNSGTDTVIGGTGTDTLNIDWSAVNPYFGWGGIHFSVRKADGSWEYFGEGVGGVGTIDTLLAAFAASPTEYGYTFIDHSVGVTFSGIERINVDGTSGNDVIVAQTDSSAYAGNGGTDTFFGDFSSWTEAVTWTNGADATNSDLSDEAVSILGDTHQVKVSGMERLRLLTGSGNDTIVQNVTDTNDEIQLGAGDDSVQAWSGYDIIWGGAGTDTAVFLGVYSDYQIDAIEEGVRVTSLFSGGDGMDDLYEIERLQFSDQIVNLNNHPPTASNSRMTTDEDVAKVLAVSDFGFSDVDADDSLQSIKITSLSTAGTLKYNGLAVTVNRVITAADIIAGKLVFAPAANANGTGYASFGFKVSDGSVLSLLAYTMTIDVTAVRDDLTKTGTSGNDTLSGDSIDVGSYDKLYGLVGNDSLSGLAGNDILDGGTGDDTLNGGTGTDTMTGGLGNDIYLVDNVGDTVVETSILVTELDTVKASISYTLGDNVENLTLTGTSAINGTGNALDNVLIGNSAANILSGDLGDDTYITGAGDSIVENADEGTDTVLAATSWTLGANLENLTLTGTSAINGTGNTLENLLTGNSAANILSGGLGNDTYIAGVGDSIVENANEGTDTVLAATSWTLGANLENLTLTGTAAINGKGNALNNILVGNSAANILTGGLGNDTYLVDLIKSGTVAVLQDTVTENLNEGNDTLQLRTAGELGLATATTLTLGANLENIDLTGTGSNKLNITGNALANMIIGNGAANVLDGGAGADSMTGGAGNDTYVVDNAGDTVIEALGEGIETVKVTIATTNGLYTLGDNIENATLLNTVAYNLTGNDLDNVLTGNVAANTLTGLDGNDTLDGKAGADTMVGGLGDDSYYVDNAGDVVIETSALATEIDTVNASISYTLGDNVENLTLTGTAAINGIGDGLDNVLVGNSAANVLDGGAGADTMIGGLGNDTYLVDNADDAVIETSLLATEIDTVKASISYTLDDNVEKLTLTGTADINGTGNTLKNTILGNDGNNQLDGDAGADILKGGKGDDTYIVDLIKSGTVAVLQDTVTENLNEGTDTLQLRTAGDLGLATATTLTLAANLENIDLTDTSSNKLNVTGNALANLITGNGAANVLDGGAGADTMAGGDGNDTYVVDNAGDTVVEAFGKGIDTVNIKIATANLTFTLDNNIENAVLLNTVAYNLTGNDLDNTLTGNAAANTLTGGNGNDTLDGKVGADTMIGGAGDDTYYVDNAGDVVTELADEGADTVNSTITYTLLGKDNIENLTLLGTAVINGTGNGLDNVLAGNSAANVLDGGAGADILNGGLGNDILWGRAGSDTFCFTTALNATTNVDKIMDFNSGEGDLMALDDTIFTALSGGISDADIRCAAGAATATGAEHLIYNTTNGALYYDVDGLGGTAAKLFAYVNDGVTATSHPVSLATTDFSII